MENKITIDKFLKLIYYKINVSDSFEWDCYGRNAMCLDHETENYTIGIVFDTKNQFVYELNIWDYNRKNVVIWVSPEYREAEKRERERRGLGIVTGLYDLDETVFLMDNAADIIDIAETLINDNPKDVMQLSIVSSAVQKEYEKTNYDISEHSDYSIISVNLDYDVLFKLLLLAHEKNITFNDLCNNILLEEVKNNHE